MIELRAYVNDVTNEMQVLLLKRSHKSETEMLREVAAISAAMISLAYGDERLKQMLCLSATMGLRQAMEASDAE